MKIDKETRIDFKNTKLKNYKESLNTPNHSQEKQVKIKASADYIEYIKAHDKEAYKNYLSYSTYLELCL